MVRAWDGEWVLYFIFTITNSQHNVICTEERMTFLLLFSFEKQTKTKTQTFSPFAKHLVHACWLLLFSLFLFVLINKPTQTWRTVAGCKIDILCRSFKTFLHLKENVKDSTNPNEKFKNRYIWPLFRIGTKVNKGFPKTKCI